MSSKLTALAALSVPALDDLLYAVPTGAAVGNSVTASRLLGAALNGICDFRLTYESGVAVSAFDKTAQATTYATPYLGKAVSLYDGTRWALYFSPEVSLANAGMASGSNYDLFLYANAGVVTLLRGPAWSSDTSRGVGAGTSEVELFEGVWVNKVTIGACAARCGRLMGSQRGSAANVGERSAANPFLSNVKHRTPQAIRVQDPTDSWNSPSAIYRQTDGLGTNRVQVLACLPECTIDLEAFLYGGFTAGFPAGGASFHTSIGEDSTTTPAAEVIGMRGYAYLSGADSGAYARLTKVVPLGYHAYNWLERGPGTGTFALFGDAGAPTLIQSGISGWIMS